MHTYIHTYILACIHTDMHACMHAYIHTFTFTYVHIRTYIYIYIYFDLLMAGAGCKGCWACMALEARSQIQRTQRGSHARHSVSPKSIACFIAIDKMSKSSPKAQNVHTPCVTWSLGLTLKCERSEPWNNGSTNSICSPRMPMGFTSRNLHTAIPCLVKPLKRFNTCKTLALRSKRPNTRYLTQSHDYGS